MFSIKPCFTTTALPRLSLLPGVPLLAREGVSGATPAGTTAAGLHSPPVPALSASPWVSPLSPVPKFRAEEWTLHSRPAPAPSVGEWGT